MQRFQDTYRVDSARLKDRDYAAPGWYFVTICTQVRACFFGVVRNGVMGLSPAGGVAHRCLAGLPDHFDHARLGAFVVMPNHVHAMIGITAAAHGDDDPDANNPRTDDIVEALHATSLRQQQTNDNKRKPPPKNERMSAISPDAGSISTMVRSYKSAVTRRVRRLENARLDFAWQPRFYDHVVRNRRERRRIRRYIRGNPQRWTCDRNHPNRRP